MSNSDLTEFTTEDMYAAAFLIAHDFRLLRLDSTPDGRRKSFVFDASASKTAASFYANEPAPARVLFRAWNDLRSITKRF